MVLKKQAFSSELTGACCFDSYTRYLKIKIGNYDMNKLIFEGIADLVDTIEMVLNAKKQVPALILIYSTLDTLAWLNMPLKSTDVTRKDFLEWTGKYLLPGTDLNCKPIDLYAARCGLVHSSQSESRLSREGEARLIWYAWGEARVSTLQIRIKQLGKEEEWVAVKIEVLLEALKNGISRFLESMETNEQHSELINSRATKFFINIPHDSL